MRDYLKLHIVILLWGLTAVLGKLIDLSATQVVLYRSIGAALILLLCWPGRIMLPRRLALALVINGMILGFHWMMFFLAVKIANVSICMIGMATISFWTALLEPMLIRGVRFRWINLALGCLVVAAVYWIYRNETEFHYGLLVALFGAILATVFSIINGLFAGKVDEQSVVLFEMIGASLFCGATLVIAEAAGHSLASSRWMPTAMEWLWLAVLILGGTLIAYRMYVQLLRRLSVFTINFANNLEPVYGISLGAVFFADHHLLGGSFYVGTTIILAAVLVQPWLLNQENVPVPD